MKKYAARMRVSVGVIGDAGSAQKAESIRRLIRQSMNRRVAATHNKSDPPQQADVLETGVNGNPTNPTAAP
jgi:hypothetical protein